MSPDNLKAWQDFTSNVGIPMAILFIVLMVFALPLFLMVLSFVKRYANKTADAHLNFMECSSRTQETNAQTLAKLEETIAIKHQDHAATHQAIRLGAQAGLAILDGDRDEARQKLERVDEVLTRQG